ncbi:MAG TPA: hypothetical protein VNJ28_08280, partial [Candidatus Limnocylindrales bacterium]|nr:hypothetical protein [Candidatus Limnocylindrales bacterium]
ADYCSGFLWGLSSAGAGAGAEPVRLLETGLTPSSFGEDGSGEVYLVDHAGWIVRIVGRPR